MHCVRMKKVRMRGNGMVRRCAKYSGGSRSKSKRRGGYRRHRPFNKGKKCVHMGYGRTGKPVCKSYGARPRSGRYHVAGPMMPSGAFFATPLWTRP